MTETVVDQDSEGSVERYFRALIETMNEGFMAVDDTDQITLFNRQMERMTGYSSEEVLGAHFSEVYAPESLQTLEAELTRRRHGESSTYEARLRHKDGTEIPARISGAPLLDGDGSYAGCFAVITDISRQILAEHELESGNRRIKQLLHIESKRAAHADIVNQVARLVLSTLDPQEIFERVVRAVQEHFGYHHAYLFQVEEESDQIVLRAHAGAYESHFEIGYRQQIGTGIVGTVVASGEPFVTLEAAAEPARILAFPEEINTRSELCVPIKIGERVIGALDVQSQAPDDFDDNDLQSLRVLADQLAWVIHNARLYQETLQLKELSEQVLESVPLPVLLLDRERRVISANGSYCSRRQLDPTQLIGHLLSELAPDSILFRPAVQTAFDEVLRTGVPSRLEQLEMVDGSRRRVLHLLLNPVDIAEPEAAEDNAPSARGGMVLVTIEDITENLENAYQSSLLRQIGQTMQGILDLDKLLYAILTCVTAGTALGFDRAVLLLVNAARRELEGRMGVGPANHDEASHIWHELALQNPSVEEILENYDRLEDPSNTPLSEIARAVIVPLDDADDVLARSVRECRTFAVSGAEDPPVGTALRGCLNLEDFVVVPLVAKQRAVGVIFADNIFSRAPISDENVDLLTGFASQAALALESAELYRSLEEQVREVEKAYDALEHTQDELVRSERLAVIGEMSARVAHEIRNPLATIGGFARFILKQPDADRVQYGAHIIVEEVERLERLLTGTLALARPSGTEIVPADLNEIYYAARGIVGSALDEHSVTLREELATDLPLTHVDFSQIKQVLINVMQNALQAMPSGGELRVATRAYHDPEKPDWIGSWVEIEVGDTGEGIPAADLDKVFSPFFTTKSHGTGLGLAICAKIVDDHGGRIAIDSGPETGTTVRIAFQANGSQTTGGHTS